MPEQVNIAYGETRLAFGRDYIIPKPFDPRLIAAVPPAVARAAMESGVAKAPITDWAAYEEELLQRLGHDHKLVRMLHNRAKTNPKKIVFPEGDQLDVLKAAQIVHDEGIATPVLLGRRDVIEELMNEIEFDADIEIIDPKGDEMCEKKEYYAQKLWERRNRDGISLFEAQKRVRDRNYYAAMMVNEGDADGLVSGYSRSYPTVVKPLFELIGKAPEVERVAAMNLMITERGPMFLADTSINIDPSAKELAIIAKMTAQTARLFGIEPVIAMLSYANFGSSKNIKATKVSEAVEYLHENYPDICVDGEIQSDFALNREMLQSKFPFSKIAGKKVNTLVFPNLESANITYKLMKELNRADSVGPILLGMAKPVHVLQLGAGVDEIVNMTAVAVVDAQEKEKRAK